MYGKKEKLENNIVKRLFLIKIIKILHDLQWLIPKKISEHLESWQWISSETVRVEDCWGSPNRDERSQGQAAFPLVVCWKLTWP